MVNFIYRYSTLFLVSWILIIFLLCSIPGQFIPTANWMDLLSLDKLVHAGIFFILCILFFLFAFKRRQKWPYLIVYTVLSMLYGISLEWMQANWFSQRSFDYFDMLANASGCCLALIMHKVLYRKFNFWWH